MRRELKLFNAYYELLFIGYEIVDYENESICLEYFGNRWWYKDFMLHREDGPAVELDYDYNEYWLNNKRYSEKEFMKARKHKI